MNNFPNVSLIEIDKLHHIHFIFLVFAYGFFTGDMNMSPPFTAIRGSPKDGSDSSSELLDIPVSGPGGGGLCVVQSKSSISRLLY